ncbi:hypothetical protein AR457_27435 [Streptomyces agglomeratus]|uniref:DUF4190 domain-containing protein n=1 Tax=Streptomyces agglomeratus TaxID=285458 RepID=A0A1E5PDN0_9ACTN|nr:hypothetical protein [Streptomyces agglomeratus]OEJ27637.1 hypothetical protein AS594_27305 [Streptomyces agglomeratus]OEJ38302.1 hypothetical protein BGK70_09220 [Streptomyces agglomeratus]OEJ47313.1 hypothetical protein AR457_27435 [Streptomyces agglomeratus]OEJ50830.1 hypothetical protein BGK72_08705 [Streptomyces agglomeratus]OEJ58193.1 hypothetical protein BGM19_09570 [Streptomyces agglomeratus]
MPEPTVHDRTDTPAVALGPTALVLGAVTAIWPWVPLFPVALLAGPLSVTFGVAGMYYAGQGIGRMWTAVTGTVLGAAGFVGVFLLFVP